MGGLSISMPERGWMAILTRSLVSMCESRHRRARTKSARTSPTRLWAVWCARSVESVGPLLRQRSCCGQYHRYPKAS
nr:MAG TPA: hypothetical protein [Caudoviricetes sp.]